MISTAYDCFYGWEEGDNTNRDKLIIFHWN